MFRIIIFTCLLGLSFSAFSVKRSSFFLKDESEKQTLLALLDEAVHLHGAVYSQDEDRIHLSISKIMDKIEQLRVFSVLMPYHELSYRDKLLQNIAIQLETLKSPPGQNRKYNMNIINREFTNLIHIYGLEKKYIVFFCSKDRSVWIQSKTEQALHLDYQSCGAPVGT